MSQETFEQSFAVSGQARLHVDNIRGTVRVQAGKEAEIRVVAIKHSDDGDAEQTWVEINQDSSGLVIAKTHYGKDGLKISGKPCQVDYVITAPTACDLKLSCVSSEASVQGLSGSLKLHSVSGELSLHELAGKLEVHTVSGDVSAENIKAELELNSVSGDVTFRRADLPCIEASTVSGDLEFETAIGGGPYHLNSVSADARFTVPPDTGCEIDMHSLSGGLETNLSATYHHQTHQLRRVTVQQGGATINFHSLSGNFSLGAAGAPSPAAARRKAEVKAEQIPAQAAESLDRMSVLDRIERGELSVEEGINLLENL